MFISHWVTLSLPRGKEGPEANFPMKLEETFAAGGERVSDSAGTIQISCGTREFLMPTTNKQDNPKIV